MKNIIIKVKSKVHALLFWQTSLGDVLNQIYGMVVFYTNSFTQNRFPSKYSEIAFLTKQYHIIEKGLALPKPRKAFGEKKINLLIYRLEKYIANYGEDELTITIKNCLSEYIEFNRKGNVNLNTSFFKRVIKLVGKDSSEKKGGTKYIIKPVPKSHDLFCYENFVKSRYSVRDFELTNLDVNRILKAIDIAKHSPSVCNRQAWKAHVYSNKPQILKLLKLQGGNNGFTNSINKLIIITTDTKCFTKLESNQVFVDGGIFSMNLVLALHSLNIGACCLNTCFPYTTEKTVKKIGEICNSERLIMMIGVGNLKEEYKVAISRKKKLNDISKIH